MREICWKRKLRDHLESQHSMKGKERGVCGNTEENR